jgi:hypothetical protein
LNQLAWVLVGVCDSLEPPQAEKWAGAAAPLIVTCMGKTTNASALADLATALVLVADKLTAPQAQKWAGAAAQLLVCEMGKNPESLALGRLAEQLAALAVKLEPQQAKQLAGAAAQLLVARLGKPADPLFAMLEAQPLAAGLAVLADKLEPQVGTELLVNQVGKTADYRARVALAMGLINVAKKLDSQQAQELNEAAAHLVITYLGINTDYDELSGTHARVLGDIIGKLDRQVLVNALKDPFCVTPARQIVLKELGRRAGQTFADLWEFVSWAEQHEPTLDLRTPWTMPKALNVP